ncbi:Multidomain esterase [Colletotrichum fructicola]|nr:Multidomain esterase [Colletotrichum fructicola]
MIVRKTMKAPVKSRADKPELRILPLGASIVFGVGSSTGNGFRKPLRDALRYDGFEVNMVGTRHNGNMQDWDNEATSGAIVSEIRSYLKGSLAYKPNVVVINGGTNDCNRNIDINNIGERMRLILNDIWGAPDMANTCVMLSTILPTADATGALNRITANQQYRLLTEQLAASGKCIYMADMDPDEPSIAHNWIALGADIGGDGIHPNDQGHKKMASVFHDAIIKAVSDGKIKNPATMAKTGTTGCDKTFGNGVYAGGLTQRGSGWDDGTYKHASEYGGLLFSVTSDWDRDQWRFARLFTRDRDDLLGWFEKSAGVHAYGVWKNNGNGKFDKIADLDPDLFCNPRGVRFIDMNADGLDDLVCIDPDGNLYLSINQGDGSDSKPPTFKRVSTTAKIKDTEGFKQDRIVLADIDGDGRGDYCHLDDGGNVWCWRNGWVDDIPEYWQALGLRFTAKGMGDVHGVRFEDINGDGRDDWLWVDNDGVTYTWTSARSCASGKLGDGLNVAWRQGFNGDATSGPTHMGMANFGEKDTNIRNRIHFGRIFGEPQAFSLLGQQDYIYMEHSNTTDGEHKFDVHVWKNVARGGTKLLADGNKYCNMLGHTDGRMDYVWVLSTGRMTLYPNAGKSHISGDESFWGPMTEEIWSPQKWIFKDADRRDLHLVDWDGDGACDIVYTDPDKNNSPQVWLNTYPLTGRWDWTYIAKPAPQVQCNERKGLGIHDLAVRFANIDGGKRGDYLCIKPNGYVSGWVHKDDGTWEDVGQVKFQEGKDRANLRWADVNGDGKDDMLWVDKFNGDGYVWYNGGRGDRGDLGGSLYFWRKISDPVYDGNHAGTCMYYPDLDGNGRADMHSIIGTFNNQAETWFNPSCAMTDRTGDDGDIGNPNLPVQPGSSNGGGGDGGDSSGGEDYDPNPDDHNTLPVCDETFDNFDKLVEASDDIPDTCATQYVLQVGQATLQAAVKRYDEIMKGDYDKYFQIYADYLVQNSADTLEKFMRDNGADYFDCDVREQYTCCAGCDKIGLYGDTCKHCVDECPIKSPWGDAQNVWWDTFAETCPPNEDLGIGTVKDKTIFWKLREKDKNNFWGEVTATVGAPEEKLPIVPRQQIVQWSESTDMSCVIAQSRDPDNLPENCYNTKHWYDAPIVKDFKASDVVNPKEVVQKALGDSSVLIDALAATLMEIKTYMYTDDTIDVSDAVILPILMIQHSLSSMEDVVEMAKDIEKMEKTNFIVNLISSVLFVLPVAGEILGTIGLAGFGRALIYVSEAGNAAMGIYSVVSEPKSAPLALFGAIMSVKSIRNANNMRNAVKARRAMGKHDIEGFSKVIASKLEDLDRMAARGEVDETVDLAHDYSPTQEQPKMVLAIHLE